MKAIVTGGAGFIGSHIVDALVTHGHQVIVIDDLSSGTRDNVASDASLVEADIRDAAVRAPFESLRPDVVFHLAAQMDVRKSVADPCFDADVNVRGTLRLLELCREVGTKRFVFASTGGAIYGEQDAFPADESHAERPVSPYGVAKLSVERYLHFYTVEYGFEATALRYGNVYGPRQNPHGEAGVVAIFAHKMLAGDAPTIFNGGEQTRDYVYVADVVRANLLSLEKGLTGAFNVGTGVETTVNELYARMQRVLDFNQAAIDGPTRPGEQLRSCIGASKLSRAAGWKPEVTLDEGLARTLEYFRKKR